MLFSGGNSLENAPAGRVTDFVKAHGGHTVITKVSAASPLGVLEPCSMCPNCINYDLDSSRFSLPTTVRHKPDDIG